MTTVTVMHFVRQVAPTVLLLQLTVDGQRVNRATVTNKRKVLSEEGTVSVMRQIGIGNKEAGISREFGLGNSTIQKIWKKAQPKLIVGLKRTDRE
jgi:hypothetical protein